MVEMTNAFAKSKMPIAIDNRSGQQHTQSFGIFPLISFFRNETETLVIELKFRWHKNVNQQQQKHVVHEQLREWK